MNALPIAVATAPASLSLPGSALPALPSENTDFHLVLRQASSNNVPASVADSAIRATAERSQQSHSGAGTPTGVSTESEGTLAVNTAEGTLTATSLSSKFSTKLLQAGTTVHSRSEGSKTASIAETKRSGARAANASALKLSHIALCASSNPTTDHPGNPVAAPLIAPNVQTDTVPRTPPISPGASADSLAGPGSRRADSAITQLSPILPAQGIALPSSGSLAAAGAADTASSAQSSSAAPASAPAAESQQDDASESLVSSFPLADSSGTPSISGAPLAASTGLSLSTLASTEARLAARAPELKTPVAMPNPQTSAASRKTEHAAASQAVSETALSDPGQQIFSLHSPSSMEPVTRAAAAPIDSTPGVSDISASRQAERPGRVRSESTSTRNHADAAPEKTADVIATADHAAISAAASVAGAHPATPLIPAQSATSTATAPAATLPQSTPDVSAVLGQRPQNSSPGAAPAQALPNPAAEPPRVMGSAQLHVGEGSNELKISVQLPELGKVEVRAVTTHDVTTAHLTAFRHDGFQALTADRGGLEQALKSRDVILGSLDSHANGHSTGQQRQQGSHSTAQNASDNTPLAAVGTSIASETDHPGFLPDHASISVRA